MEGGDWITLGAVIVALGIGVASILHTQSLQKRERRERLLNEIIEWARKSAESAIYRQGINKHELWSAKLNYKNCMAVSEYIKEIAASSFSTLSSHIDDVDTKLDEAIKGTTRFLDSKLSDDHDRMRNCEDELTNAVEELFKEAAKIKTRDMGKGANISKEGEDTMGKEPTMKDIEEHLKRQDKEMALATWGTFAALGLAIFVFAYAYITEDFFWTRIFLLVVGGFMMISSIIMLCKSRVKGQ